MKDILLPILTVLYLGFGLPVNFRINERLFSNEELIATIDESLNTHL